MNVSTKVTLTSTSYPSTPQVTLKETPQSWIIYLAEDSSSDAQFAYSFDGVTGNDHGFITAGKPNDGIVREMGRQKGLKSLFLRKISGTTVTARVEAD